MSPRPDVSEARKAQILTAATTVFARLGFRSARMDDVVAETGLSKGALYWYFKSKDDLVIGILDKLLARELAHLHALQEDGGPASVRLEQFIALAIEDLNNLLPLLPMYYEFFALAARHKTIQLMFSRYFRSFMDILIPIIQDGIDRGEFRQVDAREAAIALGAALEGTVLLMIYDPENVDLSRHLKSSAAFVLYGLQKTS
jgi:AcrR family transcriptional regulator